MAYCNHCGAYIPDGQQVCVACGYDPEAEKRRAAEAQAAARAYQEAPAADETDPRADFERRRAERKANDRAWAENERRLRQMEEDFRRAQEEKERRAESYVNRGGKNKRVSVNIGDGLNVDVGDERVSVNIGGRRYTFGGGETEEDPVEETRDLGEEIRRTAKRTKNKGMAAISYLGVLVFLPILFGMEDEFVKFHSTQGLKLFCYTMLGSALGSFIGVGWIATLLGFGLSIKGIANAVNGVMEELPILRKLTWFSEKTER